MKKNISFLSLIAGVIAVHLFAPGFAFADIEGSLTAIQDKIIFTFLPIFAVIGLALAGMSFVTGNPNAKQHAVWAVMGCVIGFGAQGIVDLVRSLVS